MVHINAKRTIIYSFIDSRGTKVAYRAKTHIFFTPERYTVGILYTDSRDSAWYETTV